MRNRGICNNCGGDVFYTSTRCVRCGTLQQSGSSRYAFRLQVAAMIGVGLIIFAVPVILMVMWARW